MNRLPAAFVIVLLLMGSVNAADLPKLQGHVNDYAGLLQPRFTEALESRLKQYEAETTHQIVVLTVSSLNGESVEEFSRRVFNSWGLGRKGIDNGVLVTIAASDHRARIELGLGINRFVSNADASKIMDQEMVPEFRRGHYDIGLEHGIESLIKACRAYKVSMKPVAPTGVGYGRNDGRRKAD